MTTPERHKLPAAIASEPGQSLYDRRASAREARIRPAAEAFDPYAVPFDPGVYLVEASAGTGKTFSLTLTVLRLLLERDAAGEYRVRDIGNILVVTFTNAATSELITRVRDALRRGVEVFTGAVQRTDENAHLFALRDQYGADAVARLRDALSRIDTLAIFTIHGFCKRVLDESALESGTAYGAGFIENDDVWIERVTQDWWRRTVYENPLLAALVVSERWRHDAFVRDLGQWQRWPATRIDPDETLATALDTLDAALRALSSGWEPARAESFLAEQAWRKNAPLGDPEQRQRILRSADALLKGNVLAGLRFVRACTTTAIRDEKTGIKIRPRDKFEQVPEEPFVHACDEIVAAIDCVHRALRVSCLRGVARQFDAEKRRRHLMGFDDLLHRLRDALDEQGEDGLLANAIRARYDAALIDEFQDTDPYQFPIFSKAFAGRPLFLIGDPKQAIYAFRGADIFAYRQAVLAADRVFTLGQNWRSTPAMVTAVNALVSRRPNPFLYDWIDFPAVTAARADAPPLPDDGRAALHWWYVPGEGDDGAKPLGKGEAEARIHRALARECVHLLTTHDHGGAGLAPERIAVLVRDSFEARKVQRELRAAGVPCILAKLGDVLHSDEVRDLERIMAAILTPQDGRAVRAALATELWGKTAGEIHALSRADGERDWLALLEQLVDLREMWVQRGFLRMMQSFIAAQDVAERLLARDGGERRLTNLRQGVELCHALSVEERLSPEGLLLRVARARTMKTEESERTELRLESDADAVQIVTIHKSKGLEYDVVFCPGLWACRPVAPDAPVLVHEDEQTVVFDHGSPEREGRGRLAEAERIAEDLRLVYVALTRARRRCYVAWGAVTNKTKGVGAWRSGLAYLLRPDGIAGPPADVVEQTATSMQQCISAWQSELEALVQSSGSAMSFEVIGDNESPVVRWSGPAATVTDPAPRSELPTASQLDTWRIASFTSLTAAHHGGTHHPDDARDVADHGHERGSLIGAMPPLRGRDDFLAFPAGRVAGIVLHELFENLDFAAPVADVRALAQEILLREQMAESPTDDRIGAVTTMATRVVTTQLPGAHFALRDVPRSSTLREWSFDLPLGRVERDTLARLFATHGGDVAQRYASALRRIAADGTHGFLTGVIDLVFLHEGRWYVLDWKSNHLGDDPARYEPPALEREMFGSHYVLQYHLYVTALHRYLRARVPGYDYDTHMGGVWYAFLRGIDGSGRGWFADRPPKALIDALDALMDGRIEASARERVA